MTIPMERDDHRSETNYQWNRGSMNLKTWMEIENLTQYTRPQKAFSIGLRTHWVGYTDLKIFFRPIPYALFPISISAFRYNF